MSLPGLGLNTPFAPQDTIRQMGTTETFTTRLDDIYPGLRIIDKFHPQNENFSNPSYQQVFGLKGQDINTSLLNNTLIPKIPLK